MVTQREQVTIYIRKVKHLGKIFYRREKSHYIMINWLIHQEDIIVVNLYSPNIEAGKYVKQILTEMKKEIDINKSMIGDFNMSLTIIVKSSRQKINMQKKDLIKHYSKIIHIFFSVHTQHCSVWVIYLAT